MQIVGKRWKLDLHSLQEASLMLSAVNLPGGVQVKSLDNTFVQLNDIALYLLDKTERF